MKKKAVRVDFSPAPTRTTRMEAEVRTIDVETLVQWAWRDELPKREGYCEGGTAGPGWRMERVDGGRPAGAGLPAFREWMGAPHADALAIEAAALALEPRRIAWRDVLVALLGAAAPLVPIARGRDGEERPCLPSLVECQRQPAVLIAVHARLRSRPCFGDDQRVEPVRHLANGRPMVIMVDGETGEQLFDLDVRSGLPVARPAIDKAGRIRMGAACPVRLTPGLGAIARERLEWALWHDALMRLAAALDGRLSQWRALPPAAPAMPWRKNMAMAA